MTVKYRIEADLMIHGRLPPVEKACVIIEGREISYAGPAHLAPPGDTSLSVPVVMPGMWDSHCHFFGITSANLTELIRTPIALRALRSAQDAERALMAGFTSLRDLGGLGTFLSSAVEEGRLLGPNIYAAGSILSMTGGHGDIHSLPIEFVEDGDRVVDLELCDGVSECVRAVRRQLRKGAKVIKVCASGGVLSELDSPEHGQFSGEELQAIVQEGARADRIVAAHCHGKAGIMAALRAGVRTIEHGTYLDREAARAMADSGAVLVATRFIGEALLADSSSVELPDFARKKLQITFRRGFETVQHALSEGVTIAAGTDILVSGDMWGRNARELSLLVEAGMTPAAALTSCTANGPMTVGLQAARTGILEPGYIADVLAVSANPLEDIAILEDPNSVTHVWRGGELFKGAVGPMYPSESDPDGSALK